MENKEDVKLTFGWPRLGVYTPQEREMFQKLLADTEIRYPGVRNAYHTIASSPTPVDWNTCRFRRRIPVRNDLTYLQFAVWQLSPKPIQIHEEDWEYFLSYQFAHPQFPCRGTLCEEDQTILDVGGAILFQRQARPVTPPPVILDEAVPSRAHELSHQPPLD